MAQWPLKIYTEQKSLFLILKNIIYDINDRTTASRHLVLHMFLDPHSVKGGEIQLDVDLLSFDKL